jgi:hypothetical protein
MSPSTIRRTGALTLTGLLVVGLAGAPAAGGPLPDPGVATDGNLIADHYFAVGDPALHPVSCVIAADPGAQSAAVISRSPILRIQSSRGGHTNAHR